MVFSWTVYSSNFIDIIHIPVIIIETNRKFLYASLENYLIKQTHVSDR